MTTTNLVLTSIDSSSLIGSQGMYYQWKQTSPDGTKEVFAIKSSTGAWSYSDMKHAIAVVKSTNTWVDYGYSHPETTNDSGPLGMNSAGTELHITDSSFSNWYKFAIPTAATGAWWISSSSGAGTLGGAVGTPVWTPSFLDNGNGTMVATVTGSPSNAFGVGFDAVTFLLFEKYEGGEAMVAFITFPNNTTTQVMDMASVTYNPSKCYEVRYGSNVLGPRFGTCPMGKRKVHCNFW